MTNGRKCREWRRRGRGSLKPRVTSTTRGGILFFGGVPRGGVVRERVLLMKIVAERVEVGDRS